MLLRILHFVCGFSAYPLRGCVFYLRFTKIEGSYSPVMFLYRPDFRRIFALKFGALFFIMLRITLPLDFCGA